MNFDFAAIQAFIDKFSLLGMPAIVVVFGLVALAKLLGMPSRWAPVAAVIAGFLVSSAIYLIEIKPAAEPIVRFITLGLMLGLATVGGHAGLKAVFGRFQQVPPGTVIKLPSGQTDTTPTGSFTEGVKGPKPKGTI